MASGLRESGIANNCQKCEPFSESYLIAPPLPFGIVLLEAGAFGLPVVASRVGGIPEILTDGFTGRLVSPDNPVELALCLRSLLDAPIAAQEMGARLRDHVMSKFTWSEAYGQYISMVRKA